MQFFRCIWVAIPVDWVILHWCACGADGQINGRPVGQCTVLLLPNFLGWVNLLSYGAPLLPQSTLSLSVSLLSSPSSSLASSILVPPSAILQWNLFLWNTPIQGTPLFRRHKILSRKNVHIIFVSVTSIEETPLFRGKGHFVWVLKPWFNLHLGDTLALKKWLTKNCDKFKCTLVTMMTAFTKWTISLKSM